MTWADSGRNSLNDRLTFFQGTFEKHGGAVDATRSSRRVRSRSECFERASLVATALLLSG
jgi:hypothetical protein